jgi:hypothetical protein
VAVYRFSPTAGLNCLDGFRGTTQNQGGGNQQQQAD